MPTDASPTKYPFPEPDGSDVTAQFEHLADAIPQHIWGADPLGDIDYKNKRGREFFHVSEAAPPLKGEWITLVHPEDRSRASQLWLSALDAKTPYECEFRLRRHDGEYIWHLAQALPYRDRSGTVVRWFGTNTDISRQKAAEEQLRRAYEELDLARAVLAQSNAELDQFATLVAHDLRGPLRSMEASLADLREDRSRVDALDRAARGVAMTSALITRLLDSSRVLSEQVDRRWVDLHAMVEEVTELLGADIKLSGATVTMTEPLPKVWADPVQLREVLQNIVANAIHYAGNAPPRIDVGAEQNDTATLIHIRDEGIGFSQSDATRVFDQHTRLKGSQGIPGMGLGLAICKRIIQRHGGEIRAKSAIGQGTTITIKLPSPRLD